MNFCCCSCTWVSMVLVHGLCFMHPGSLVQWGCCFANKNGPNGVCSEQWFLVNQSQYAPGCTGSMVPVNIVGATAWTVLYASRFGSWGMKFSQFLIENKMAPRVFVQRVSCESMWICIWMHRVNGSCQYWCQYMDCALCIQVQAFRLWGIFVNLKPEGREDRGSQRNHKKTNSLGFRAIPCCRS